MELSDIITAALAIIALLGWLQSDDEPFIESFLRPDTIG
jgi:hypothetical protein